MKWALIPTLLFFVFGLFQLSDIGVTWDEWETLKAGETAIYFVRHFKDSRPALFESSGHRLPGYQFVWDILRVVGVKIITKVFSTVGIIRSLHLTQLVVSSLSLFLFGFLLRLITNQGAISVMGICMLALLPQWLGHSQNNPKDSVGLLMLLATFVSLLSARETGNPKRYFFAGIILGVAQSTCLFAWMAPVVVGIWDITGRRRLRNKFFFGITIPISVILFILSWPWLWDAPIQKILWTLRTITKISPSQSSGNLFWGHLYSPSHTPRAYFLWNVFSTTPLFVLFFVLVALVRLKTLWKSNDFRFFFIWSMFIFVIEALNQNRYDGIRHFLTILPAMVGFSLMGFYTLSKTTRSQVVPWLMCLFAFHFSELKQLYPYYNAYLNPISETLLTGPLEKKFETEYWGQSYLDAFEWIRTNADSSAEVLVPFAFDAARTYWPSQIRSADSQRFYDRSRRRFLVYMTRTGFLPEWILQLEKTEKPVYAVIRRNRTLLKIFSNQELQNPSPFHLTEFDPLIDRSETIF